MGVDAPGEASRCERPGCGVLAAALARQGAREVVVLAILAARLGGGWWPFWWFSRAGAVAPGVLPVLVLVAGFVLLSPGAIRATSAAWPSGSTGGRCGVAAYAELMRDEYPPFRLDR